MRLAAAQLYRCSDCFAVLLFYCLLFYCSAVQHYSSTVLLSYCSAVLQYSDTVHSDSLPLALVCCFVWLQCLSLLQIQQGTVNSCRFCPESGSRNQQQQTPLAAAVSRPLCAALLDSGQCTPGQAVVTSLLWFPPTGSGQALRVEKANSNSNIRCCSCPSSSSGQEQHRLHSRAAASPADYHREAAGRVQCSSWCQQRTGRCPRRPTQCTRSS